MLDWIPDNKIQVVISFINIYHNDNCPLKFDLEIIFILMIKQIFAGIICD